MWRLARVQHHGLSSFPTTVRSSIAHHRRTLVAAAAANTTTSGKRALNKDKLLSHKPSKKTAAMAGSGGGGGGGGGGGTSPPPPSKPTPVPPPPSSGGGGGGMMQVVLGGTAVVAAGAAYVYYNDKDFIQKMPWSKSAEDTAKPAEDTAAATKDEGTPKEKDSETSSESAATTAGGHRVTQIEMPPDMMNKSASSAAVSVEPHPEKGNRVSMEMVTAKKEKKKRPKKHKKDDVVDTHKTEAAAQDLQSSATTEAAKALVESHQKLWTSLESEYVTDLDALSRSQLKTRVIQLATEMKDRTQWEAVRLKEFLALKEKETAQTYTEILQKQRLEFEEILATRLREQDAAFHERLKETLSQKDASIQTVVNAALEAQQEEHNQDKEAFATKFQNETQIALNKQYGEQMEAYKQAMEQDLQQKVATLTELAEKLQTLELALETSQRNQQGSSQAHKLSAAALALSEVLETHAPAGKEVLALEAAAGQDGVIATAVRALPSSVQTDGVPTLSELQTKFEENYSTCRQAALVPQGRPGLDGQLAGMVFAALKYPPQADDPAPEDNPNSAEHLLARARKHIQLGELSTAVEELEKLQGQVAFVVGDWKKAAMDRVAVDKAVKVIKLECALLHESVVE